jgi:4-oxalomesaconate tautomerase
MLTAIPATLMRGGTSKGLFFDARDLPADTSLRNRVLLAAMGSPDSRQIDGLGGAHPLTSKVAVISRSERPEADVDYLFLQVAVDKAEVSDSQNCGNMLAGVGPWAIERGLVPLQGETTQVRIYMANTGSVAVAHVATPEGKVEYEGDARFDGVPGTAAPIPIDFIDVAGGSCGSLLPTGNVLDVVDGINLTCIDNGMPVVLMRAEDFGKTGYEAPADLEADDVLKSRVEALRLQLGPMMKLDDVSAKTVPKMCLIAAPQKGGAVSTRTFIPHRVHEAIGVLGALSVATGCVLRGSVADGIARVEAGNGEQNVEVEHPTGSFTVNMDIAFENGAAKVRRAALLRTARKLMTGEVFIPATVWGGP